MAHGFDFPVCGVGRCRIELVQWLECEVALRVLGFGQLSLNVPKRDGRILGSPAPPCGVCCVLFVTWWLLHSLPIENRLPVLWRVLLIHCLEVSHVWPVSMARFVRVV